MAVLLNERSMRGVICGLIGLALAMTTSACKRSEAPPAATVRRASVPLPRPKVPEMTLERGLETEWTEICVAYAWYEECAGIATGDQFLITRKDGRMMIAGREQIAFQKFRELPDRPLEKGEFVEIVKKLRLFHGLAKSETAEVKAFESFPPEERKREIADYYKLTGRRYLESSKLYFWVRFDPNTDDKTTIRESFLNEMSADGYNNWVQTILKGLDAVP